MVPVRELREFLDGIHDDVYVGIDDGGLTIVLATREGHPTGSYFEIGGLPLQEDRDGQAGQP